MISTRACYHRIDAPWLQKLITYFLEKAKSYENNLPHWFYLFLTQWFIGLLLYPHLSNYLDQNPIRLATILDSRDGVGVAGLYCELHKEMNRLHTMELISGLVFNYLF